ncbi:MAG: HAD-IA family hydrolase, partial [Clostridia bacterium]|nr:HAD-IA family hydrolase [Clostridia bacterium]
LLDYADIVVISYQEKIAKPNPEIYQKAIAKFDEKFDQIFMIDDRKKNLDPMIKMGYQGILFTTPEALKAELTEYL